VVKSNSSRIEVWSGLLIQAGSRSRGVLDRGEVEALNPPQCGLGVTGKSSTPWKNSCLVPGYFFAHFILAIYFEHFSFVEIELLLITIGGKTPLVIGVSRNRSSLVLLINFA
jgi:hypothetical protein